LPRAASLATKILDRFKTGVQVTLIPSSGGAFEVTADGEEIYSKLATGRFPSEGSVLADLGAKL
jgi:selenoprotein W-related protein